MQNIKYHIITFISVLIFSYAAAYTINEIISQSLIVIPEKISTGRTGTGTKPRADIPGVDAIVESGFFRLAPLNDNNVESGVPSAIDELTLIGTVTGPASIAMAMIQKRGEPNAGVFRLWRDVYGYQLISINNDFIYLKQNNERYKVELYDKKESRPVSTRGAAGGNQPNVIRSSLSKAEFQQNVMTNIDNAMSGIRAGPYRENGVIEGFRLISVRPFNILYKYGIRSGDIIKRINGKKIDSTEKLYTMWQGLTDESKMVADVDRNGQLITIEINITD
jgi:type II secretion system protein C